LIVPKEDRRAAEVKAAELARQLDLSNVTTQTVIGFLRILARQPDLKLDQVPVKMAEITAIVSILPRISAALARNSATPAMLSALIARNCCFH
jgi:hypothetical protein